MLSRDDEIKIEQYRRCSEDIRHFDRGVWQIASIATTVAGIMLGIAFTYLSGIVRVLTLLSTFLLLLAFTITISKYIHFDAARGIFMGQIEEDYFKVRRVPAKTQDVKKFLEKQKESPVKPPASWFVSQKAHQWLGVAILGMTLFMAFITIYAIYNIIYL
ncbi:MAG: hypothetical protein QMC78_04640 [Methanocellales archaeon]|nr:hypothetical protein [Methanocellales archaeon]